MTTSKLVSVIASLIAAISILGSLGASPAFAHGSQSSTNTDRVGAYFQGQSVCASPPVDFDPATATDVEMLNYGLPRRPQGSATHVSKWVAEMRLAKHRVCQGSSPAGLTLQPSIHPSTSQQTSPNWSGYVALSPSGQYFSMVEGTWVVPCYQAVGNTRPEAVSWVGLGGLGTNPLWQGGSESDQTSGYRYWWEMYPNVGIQYFNNITPSCRHTSYAEADWSVNVPGYSYVVVVNNYTGKYTSTTYHVQPNRGTAEWIEERPSCGTSKYHYYQQIDQVAWTGADATASGTNHGIAGWTNIKMTMYDTNTAQMTSVSGLMNNGTIFTDTWWYGGSDGYLC